MKKERICVLTRNPNIFTNEHLRIIKPTGQIVLLYITECELEFLDKCNRILFKGTTPEGKNKQVVCREYLNSTKFFTFDFISESEFNGN